MNVRHRSGREAPLVQRERPENARRAPAEAAARLRRAACVVILPEGRMAPPNQLLPFKTDAFVFAIRADVAVVPVAVHNASALLPGDARTGIAPGHVVVETLEPIPTCSCRLDDRHALWDRTREALLAALRPEGRGRASRSNMVGYVDGKKSCLG